MVVFVDGMLRDEGHFQINIFEREQACAGQELGELRQSRRGSSVDTETVFLSPCGRSGNQAVFRWTAPEAGQYDFDTFGSNFDTVLFAMDGAVGASLVQ